MKHEYEALVQNHTWELVPNDLSKNAVDCKWLFRIKHHSNDSVDRYKAKLIGKGFTQRPGLDHSSFSPVIKSTTVRLVLTLTIKRNLSMKQLDVNNAFLQDRL